MKIHFQTTQELSAAKSCSWFKKKNYLEMHIS